MSDAVREPVVVRPVVARLTGAAVVLVATVEPGGECHAADGATGLPDGSSHPPLPLPADARDCPTAVSQALNRLRPAGVDGPNRLLLGAEATGASDHGYPVATHPARQLDGPILWAPAVKGGVPLSTRGGDVELCLGQDLSIGYLDHDATSTRLHFHQPFTFRMPAPEAVVSLIA
ncbi:family 1 encapsulin nanocompartment shell protein [[Kitasatospora] papulosa]|uniref:family 1 encapsulin nanocompartment shell protein n=1 Tax=[Kitasatospora] papulosa TaxID=1464011 RepID=UPI0009DE47ED|nr:family 1 encapsulin nanocompartment shell protein [[Kitasatospora] papulosa]